MSDSDAADSVVMSARDESTYARWVEPNHARNRDHMPTAGDDLARLQATSHRRLNVGCGDHPLPFWSNLDADPDVRADIYCRVPPLPSDADSLDEIYAGHFLEHLTQADAGAFLDECWRCLVVGGRLGIVVPDTREVVKRYLRGDLDQIEYPRGTWRKVNDLETLCELFFYSTIQRSPHRWSYDLLTLGRLLVAHGFRVVGEIDRFADPRVALGAFYNCGLDCVK